MEFKYLHEFVILAQIGNFMEAADALYISQSALSKHIKVIESELGVPLFDRTTRKVTVNKFGRLYLPYAKNMVDLHEKFLANLQTSIENENETLTLGSIPALAQYNITDIFVNFKKSRPKATLNVVQNISEELKEMLRQKKCELAFIRYLDEEDEDLVRIPYAVDTLIAVLPATHPLADKKTVPLKMLEHEHFLLVDKSTMLYRLAIAACEQSGFEPIVDYSDHRLENLVELVIKGMGVALLMKPLAVYLSNPKISIVDITPVVYTHLNLCYLKDNELSDAAKLFLKCAEYQKSINGSFVAQELQTKQIFQD